VIIQNAVTSITLTEWAAAYGIPTPYPKKPKIFYLE